MHSLTAPATMRRAGLAALATTLVCLPKLASWSQALYPAWFSALTVALTSAVMWAFVFAWEEARLNRAPLALPRGATLWVAATGFGLAIAAYRGLALDPILVARGLGERPATVGAWAAAALFQLAFLQLFLLFAPVALCARLFRDRRVAIGAVVALGLYINWRLLDRQPDAVTTALAAQILLGRAATDACAVWFYQRGGVFIGWWIGLLVYLRHLPGLLFGN